MAKTECEDWNEGLSMLFKPDFPYKKDDDVICRSDLEKQYEKHIRPHLDVVDKLRTLGIMDEGIQLPSIVVVGDQSSGKSSVLESLACISLPRGQGIATRVPLVLRLQRTTPEQPAKISIEYGTVKEEIAEAEIKAAVDRATIALAGDGKGVKDTPISLHIRKPNAPDLTMIDLPGITRVPVHGQPEDIYEQIAAMIYHYIKPKECVILNVLSATVDFSTCESIRMSQKEDKAGDRTLAVVTKVDRAPEGLFEKVTIDAVSIGLGYICVRNRTDEERSHEHARKKERDLFATHPALSKLDKDKVGIPALAEKLTEIQARIIKSSLPGIVKKIESALLEKKRELSDLPKGIADEFHAEELFQKIMVTKRTALEAIVARGGYHRDLKTGEVNYTAHLHKLFTEFNDRFLNFGLNLNTREKTLEIMDLVAGGRGVYLPNFLNGSVFQGLVEDQLHGVTNICRTLVTNAHEYALGVVLEVLDQHAGAFPALKSSYRRSAERVLAETRDDCLTFVDKELDKEGVMVHTINEYYMDNIENIRDKTQKVRDEQELAKTSQKMFQNPQYGDGDLELAENLDESKTSSSDFQAALQMRVYLMAYWKTVHNRLVDSITMEIKYAFRCKIIDGLDRDVIREKAMRGVSAMVAEDFSTVNKRKRLQRSVQVLEECYAVVDALL